MRDLLIVLNPRQIDECISGIRELPIDKLWLRNMSELDIEDRWDEVCTAASEYDRWFITSDDGIPRRHALEAVQAFDGPVTGYSNLSREDWRVNLSHSPLTAEEPALPLPFELMHFADVQAGRQIVETNLVGFALTGMDRHLWERFPFRAYGRGRHATGYSSDYHLSKRLYDARVRIHAVREAFVFHVKEKWNHHDQEPRKQLLVGLQPASIKLERQ